MKRKIPCIILISALFSGCSLKYGMTAYDDTNIPEFSFKNASFKRYEKAKPTMLLEAERLEQYKDGKSMYGKNVSFSIFDEEGQLTTEGSCGLLSSNSDTQKYALYDDICINNMKDQMQVLADTLRWNGKTEQLTSSKTDLVTIKKDRTTIQGSGFSASGVSRSFAFTGVVTGSFITDDETEETNLEQEENNEDFSEKQ